MANRLGLEETFPFKTIEELWAWQLEPTGYTMADFEEKGFVELADSPIFFDREKLDGQFKTPSGKIEIISEKLTKAGLPSLEAFCEPRSPGKRHVPLDLRQSGCPHPGAYHQQPVALRTDADQHRLDTTPKRPKNSAYKPEICWNFPPRTNPTMPRWLPM